MLRSQTISERLQESMQLHCLPPRSVFHRVWHFFHGFKYLVLIHTSFSFASLVSIAFHHSLITENHLTTSCLFSLLVFGYGYCVLLWSIVKPNIGILLELFIGTALSLERISTPEQKFKMSKIARIARLIINSQNATVYFCISLYAAIPLRTGRLLIPMPYLPEGWGYFWFMYFVQTSLLSSGLLCYLSIIICQFEICCCLISAFRTLSEHFEESTGKEDISVLVRVHRSLLDISKMMTKMFEIPWTLFLCAKITVMVISTCNIMRGRGDALNWLFLASMLSFLYATCFLSDLLSESSESIATAINRCNWLSFDVDTRRVLVFVTFRSHKPAYFTSLFFGRLNVDKYLKIVRQWYSLVQAFLNL